MKKIKEKTDRKKTGREREIVKKTENRKKCDTQRERYAVIGEKRERGYLRILYKKNSN